MQELPRIRSVGCRDTREQGRYDFGAVGRGCQRQRHTIAHEASSSNRDATSSMEASSRRSALLLIAATEDPRCWSVCIESSRSLDRTVKQAGHPPVGRSPDLERERVIWITALRCAPSVYSEVRFTKAQLPADAG